MRHVLNRSDSSVLLPPLTWSGHFDAMEGHAELSGTRSEWIEGARELSAAHILRTQVYMQENLQDPGMPFELHSRHLAVCSSWLLLPLGYIALHSSSAPR